MFFKVFRRRGEISIKKILYIVEYFPEEPNSVADILSAFLRTFQETDRAQSIALVKGHCYEKMQLDLRNGYRHYFTRKDSIRNAFRSGEYSFTEIMRFLFWMLLLRVLAFFHLHTLSDTILKVANTKYLRRIIREERPNLVFFFVFSPQLEYAELCRKSKIPYLYVLYDTFKDRPGVDPDDGYRIEKAVIDHSSGYYVPSCFFKGYPETYRSNHLHAYEFPLLIDKEAVMRHTCKNPIRYDFSYFGQLQVFRNIEKVRDICKQAGICIDIFTADELKNDDVFHVHAPIKGDQLYTVISQSQYLIAFDNSVPYENYLPSKSYLYVSFTKPVICFGDNNDSAIKRFFRDYPLFYYQDLNADTHGLLRFLENITYSGFDEALYSKYLNCAPETALEAISKNINNIIQ